MLHKKRPKHYRFFIRKYLGAVKFVILVGCLIAFIFVARAFFFTSSFFKVEYIRISGATSFVNITDLGEVAKGQVYQKSIITFGSQELANTLLSTFQG